MKEWAVLKRKRRSNTDREGCANEGMGSIKEKRRNNSDREGCASKGMGSI